MKKYALFIPILLLMYGCIEDPILGYWERFGDDAEGTVVLVEVIGQGYHGRLIKVEGVLKELGFVEDDIKWRDVVPVGPRKWKGRDLIKVVDQSGTIQSIAYKDVYFTLTDEGVLEIKKFVKESEIVGTEQKWRKVE